MAVIWIGSKKTRQKIQFQARKDADELSRDLFYDLPTQKNCRLGSTWLFVRDTKLEISTRREKRRETLIARCPPRDAMHFLLHILHTCTAAGFSGFF